MTTPVLLEYKDAAQPQHTGTCVHCRQSLISETLIRYAIIHCRHDAHLECARAHWVGKAANVTEKCKGAGCTMMVAAPPIKVRIVQVSREGGRFECQSNCTVEAMDGSDSNVCFEVSCVSPYVHQEEH
jgi:hypothetical protein